MRSALSIVAFAALSACASTQTVLDRAPTEVFHSADSAKKVVFCLASKNNATPFEQEDGSTLVMIKNIYGSPSMTFTVYSEKSGSRIEYRKSYGTVGGVWRQCIGPDAQRH